MVVFIEGAEAGGTKGSCDRARHRPRLNGRTSKCGNVHVGNPRIRHPQA